MMATVSSEQVHIDPTTQPSADTPEASSTQQPRGLDLGSTPRVVYEPAAANAARAAEPLAAPAPAPPAPSVTGPPNPESPTWSISSLFITWCVTCWHGMGALSRDFPVLVRVVPLMQTGFKRLLTPADMVSALGRGMPAFQMCIAQGPRVDNNDIDIVASFRRSQWSRRDTVPT